MNLPDTDAVLSAEIDAMRSSGRTSATLPHHIEFQTPIQLASFDVEFKLDIDAEGHVDVVAVIDGIGSLNLDDPVQLEGVSIDKPWGREVWYSGVEVRGESRVSGEGFELPLSWYLALAPQRLKGPLPLLLMKSLEPRPEPVTGDLYFEVHETKSEVYVVTHVDPDSWPHGRGEIRAGVNQSLRRSCGSDTAFRREFGTRAGRHEQAQSIESAAALAECTQAHIVHPGDAITVSPLFPHSLRHGVTVVEFQTPVFERKIIAASQPVATQEGWDTPEALSMMSLEQVGQPVRATGEDQRLASCDEFDVYRYVLSDGTVRDTPMAHAVGTVLEGEIEIGGRRFSAGMAFFAPRPQRIAAVSAAVLLMAGPARR